MIIGHPGHSSDPPKWIGPGKGSHELDGKGGVTKIVKCYIKDPKVINEEEYMLN